MAICDCQSNEPFHETEIYNFDSDHFSFIDEHLLCEFSIKQAVELIKTKLDTKPSFHDDDTIIIKYDDNSLQLGSGEMFIRKFYEQQYYYNEKEIICEKSRRGYLDELSNDVWIIIKKYIIYSSN